jgi:hypothetical protein
LFPQFLPIAKVICLELRSDPPFSIGGPFDYSLGTITIALLQELSSLVWMGKETVSEIGDRIARKRAPFRLQDFFYQCNRVGVGSVPLVILLSVFVRLTPALLTGYQLQSFGLVTLDPPVVSVSFNSDDKKERIVLPFVSNLQALACSGLQLSVADT